MPSEYQPNLDVARHPAPLIQVGHLLGAVRFKFRRSGLDPFPLLRFPGTRYGGLDIGYSKGLREAGLRQLSIRYRLQEFVGFDNLEIVVT